MTKPSIISYSSAYAGSGSPSGSGTTSPGMNVALGDSVYVFIVYDAGQSGGVSVKSVTDNQSGSVSNQYRRAGVVQNTGHSGEANPSVEIWYADGVAPNSILEVTVTFNTSAVFAVVAVNVRGAYAAGSLATISSGAIGSGTIVSDPFTTAGSDELAIAVPCVLAPDGGGWSAGTGWTNPASFNNYSGSTANDVQLYGFVLGPVPPGSYNSDITWLASSPYAALSVGIQSPPEWRDLLGKPLVTVSPNGIKNGGAQTINDGADFGPDTPNTTTLGIQEAISSLSTGGGTVQLLPGTFPLSNYITTAGTSNLRVILDPGTVIQIPSAPTWSIHTGSTPTRIPALVIRQASNVKVTGGQITSLAAAGYDTMGILIGDGCSNVHISEVQISNMTRFGVLVNGYAGAAGSATDIRITDCSISCGVIGQGVNDGGGVRLENPGGDAVGRVWISRNTISPTYFFGVDVGGSSNSGYSVTDVHITENLIAGPPSYAGGVGVNIEGQTVAAGSLITGDISGNDISAMGGPGIQIAGGAEFLIVRGNLVQGCKAEGISISTGASSSVKGSPQQILVVDNVVKDNNKTSQGAAGIGVTVGSNLTNILYVLVSGNFCWDDQGSGATQNVGIKLNSTGQNFQFIQIVGNLCPPVGAHIPISLTGTLTGVFIKNNLGFNPQPANGIPIAAGSSPFTTPARHYPSDLYIQDPNSAGISAITINASATRGGANVSLTIPSPFSPQFLHLEPEDTATVTWGSMTNVPVITEIPQ